jgi:glutathione S-transferase
MGPTRGIHVITLYVFGPQFDLSDPSPFVMKSEMLLKIAGLEYRTDTTGFNKAPKGKLPYINDGGTIVPDSTFIRRHIETKYKYDYDKNLSKTDKAIAWAFEKMCEEHLYWAFMRERWIDKRNFEAGPKKFFNKMPTLIRPMIVSMVLGQVKKNLKAHGMGRHTRDEILWLAQKDIDSIAEFLGDKPYFMGAQPTGVDATIFAFVTGALCPGYETPLRTAAERHPNLVKYRDRLRAQYYATANGKTARRPMEANA